MSLKDFKISEIDASAGLSLGEYKILTVSDARANGRCSYGADCGGGGGQCSYGSTCSGGGGRCSYGSACSGS